MSPDVLVLAGGRGTRLKDRLDGRPKPLAPIAGRPFLDHLLTWLARHPIERVALSVGYGADWMRTWMESSTLPMEIQLIPEDSPLGTGGALLHALPHLEAGNVLVLNGDSFVNFDLDALVEQKNRSHAACCLVAREVENGGRFGCLQTSGDRVVGFLEKNGRNEPGLVNAGVYLFSRDYLASVKRTGSFSLEQDLFPSLAAAGDLAFVRTAGEFIDIGVPEDFDRAQHLIPEWIPLNG